MKLSSYWMLESILKRKTIMVGYFVGSTCSASAHCWEGDRFKSLSDTASYLKMLKMIPTAAMSGAQHKSIKSHIVTETLTNCQRPMLPLWSEKALLLFLFIGLI